MYELDFTRAQGPNYAFLRDDDKVLTFACKVDGAAKNITGASFVWELYDAAGGDLVRSLTVSVLDGAAGTWRMSWTPTDGAALLSATAVSSRILHYRAQRTLAGVKTTLLAGKFEVLPRPPTGGL